MPLPHPQLDSRRFDDLLEECLRRIDRSNVVWTDRGPSDPGMVLLELYAYLTEEMIDRLNQLPDVAYAEFLRLIGVTLFPPSAASVTLTFRRASSGNDPVEILAGTRVTVGRGDTDEEPPVFETAQAATLERSADHVDVRALHCETVRAEVIGIGSGQPGQTMRVARPPVIADSGDELDLQIGVEIDSSELESRIPVDQHGGKLFRIWSNVPHFSNLGAERHVYVADRAAGLITFAPSIQLTDEDGKLDPGSSTLAEVPPAGREIRAWYRRGGGASGNVAAETLTVLRDSVPGVEVVNVAPASGGRSVESLENALLRGPHEMRTLDRAITADDFELVALSSSRAIARARAMTQAEMWAHATPGTVELLLVPDVPEEARDRGRVSIDELRDREDPNLGLNQVNESIQQRRPLGTYCLVHWTRYKSIRVDVDIIVRRGENHAAVRERVLERLNRTISPLPSEHNGTHGWPFGRALRASHIYDIVLSEPGVQVVDQVRLSVDDVPDQGVQSLATDYFQPRTWYAGSGPTLFRSINNGSGWEPVGSFPDETILIVRPHSERPGALAAVTRLAGDGGFGIRVSFDCGETWLSRDRYSTTFAIHDLAWIERDDRSVLLIATDRGLFEVLLGAQSGPVPIVVDENDPDLGLYAVVTARDVYGNNYVAVSGQRTRGIYLSTTNNNTERFRHIGHEDEDIRALAIQFDGPHTYLWAGTMSVGEESPGAGAFRFRLLGDDDPPEGWQPFSNGWTGGSCYDLEFIGDTVVAATHRSGVLTLRLTDREAASWEAATVNSGLPLRDPGRFNRIETVGTNTEQNIIMAGSEHGVFLSDDRGAGYRRVSNREFADNVTLSPTWLFCSGEHQVKVVSDES